MKRYDFLHGNIVHSLVCKKNKNSKTGTANDWVVMTYHFSLEQVETNSFEADADNCLDCPYSFTNNNGVSGGCYTHKGLMRLGLKSKLKGLHKDYNSGRVENFSARKFREFKTYVEKKSPSLVRFGAYGEPITLPLTLVKHLALLAAKEGRAFTGYTHAWQNNPHYAPYFMASVESFVDYVEAKENGWRTFTVDVDGSILKDAPPRTFLGCPAAKENGRKLTCATCWRCNGTTTTGKDVLILKH